MAAALTLLFIGCLLQDVMCGDPREKVIMPKDIEALRGSCVTIPCSFEVRGEFNVYLDQTCEALWKTDANTVVFNSSNPQSSTIKGHFTGNLTNKDCTTTLNNMQPAYNNNYYLRVECANTLKHNMDDQKLQISVRDDPPTPTLTPPTVRWVEGTLVSVRCSAPAPCLSLPPALTWTPYLGDSHETLQDNQDKTKVKISTLTFTASHLHHRQNISCTAVYTKQDGSTESSATTSLTADISFAPQILPSSSCNKTAEQLNCSCETVGNPSPTSQWYLDGLPVNHSDKFAISSESVKDTSVRSIISVNRPQWKGLSTLSCLSSNSQGSVSQPFYVYVLEPQTCAESHDKVTLYAFITTVAALLVLVCALLLVIRSQRIHHNLPQNTVAMTQLLTSGEGNEIPNATEEDIYANVQRQGDVAYCAAIAEVNSPNFPSSGPNNVEGVNTSSEKKEEGSGVIYSGVNWKSKSKRRKEEVAGDMDQPGSSYLAEERCMLGGTCRSFVNNAMEMGNLYDEAQPRNVNKGMECEYAQVKFKSKSVKK